MRVAITGATGLLGSRIVKVLEDGVGFASLERSNGFDLARPDAAGWTRRLPAVDAILHLGARTDVDAIERERAQGAAGEAMRVNHDSTEALCVAAETRGIPLVLVSTDFVFPSSLKGPYPEVASPTEDPAQTSWYGWTKLLAERATLARPHNAVLRVSFPFRPDDAPRQDHARRLLALHATGRLYPLFDDQTFTPSYVDDVAVGLRAILQRRMGGIHHSASRDSVTPFEFAQRLVAATRAPGPALRRGRFDTSLQDGRAPRPQHGGLATVGSRRRGLVCRPVDQMVSSFASVWSPGHHTSSVPSMY